jgi:hypothetical protein
MFRLAAPLLLLLIGCSRGLDTATPDSTADGVTDQDSDGHPVADDCDDENENVHPDAVEDCTNEVDDDCDGAVDYDDTDC